MFNQKRYLITQLQNFFTAIDHLPFCFSDHILQDLSLQRTLIKERINSNPFGLCQILPMIINGYLLGDWLFNLEAELRVKIYYSDSCASNSDAIREQIPVLLQFLEKSTEYPKAQRVLELATILINLKDSQYEVLIAILDKSERSVRDNLMFYAKLSLYLSSESGGEVKAFLVNARKTFSFLYGHQDIGDLSTWSEERRALKLPLIDPSVTEALIAHSVAVVREGELEIAPGPGNCNPTAKT